MIQICPNILVVIVPFFEINVFRLFPHCPDIFMALQVLWFDEARDE